MSDTQILAVALASVPTMLAVLVGILINNSRLNDLRVHIDARFMEVNRRFADMDRKIDQRFEDMKETWRSELHRVEEVLDARLKHLEER
jgi:deoxyadenosine/deoxycytidine kinase